MLKELVKRKHKLGNNRKIGGIKKENVRESVHSFKNDNDFSINQIKSCLI